MSTSDYYFTNIQLDPILTPPHRGNNSIPTPQKAAAKDPIPQQTDTLKPGKTRVYPFMLAEKQVPVLDLTNSIITSAVDLQTVFHSCVPLKKKIPHMAENNLPQKKTPTDYISDSESSDKERNQHICTSQEERLYGDYMTLLRNQLKPLKQHYYTLWLSVILQLKEDLTENQR